MTKLARFGVHNGNQIECSSINLIFTFNNKERPLDLEGNNLVGLC
jgi:hypothetical protein